MKIKIYKKDNELVGKVIEKDEKEIAFSNLMMIDALYKHNEEVQLEFEGLSDTEKTKIMEVTFNTATGDIRSVALPQWKDTEGEFVTFNKNGSSDYAKMLTPVNSGYTKKITHLDNGLLVTFTAESGSLIISKSYLLSITQSE